MKKVISAMTAVVMTASAFASVISASAVYSSPDDVGFYLKAIPGDGYTVSEDGKTVTFASAADAAGKTVDVQHFIVADTSDPSIRQFGYMVSTSDDNMVKTPSKGVPLTSKVYDSAIEYTIGDLTFSTDKFVNTFGYLNKLKKFDSNTGTVVESNSSMFLWEKTEPNAFIYAWTYAGSDGKENGSETAHFMTDKSDDLPTSQFALEMSSDIVDGTYTVQFEQGYIDMNQGESFTQATMFNGGSTYKEHIVPSMQEGITIIVGDANANPDPEPSNEETTPSEEETTPSEEETNPTPSEDPKEDDGDPTEYAWKIGKETFDPENPEDFVMVPVTVWNDQGISGYRMDILVNGKALPDGTQDDFPFTLIMFDNDGTVYDTFGQFADGLSKGSATIASASTDSDGASQVAPQGGFVYNLVFEPKEGATFTPGAKYTISFGDETGFSNSAQEQLHPQLIDGAIIIAGGEVEEPSEEETTPSEEETTPSEEETTPSEEETTPSQEESKPTPAGDYLYGDVNKNGVVELVDIVMLNRFLTGYDNQDLDDYQVVVANCSRSGESDADTTKEHLNGQDSIEILKYLIGLVSSLPNNA